MALKRDKVSVNKDKYFDEKYFIFPFVCEKCKNEFWFEHGLRPDTKLQLLLPRDCKPKTKMIIGLFAGIQLNLGKDILDI